MRKLLDNMLAVRAFRDRALRLPWIAYDTETVATQSGLIARKDGALILDRARIALMTFCHPALGAVGIPTHYVDRKYANATSLVKELEPLFTGTTIVMHNANYDMNVTANHGVRIRDYECTITMQHCQDENFPHSLKELSQRVGLVLRETKTIDFANLADLFEYGVYDVIATARLYQAYRTGRYYDIDLKKTVHVPNVRMHPRMREPYYERVERPVIGIVVKAERQGVLLDLEHFRTMQAKMEKRLSELETEAYKKAGRVFNVRSTKQLQEILFREQGVRPIRQTKTGYSTDDATLQQLRGESPLCAVVLAHREISKLLSTYVHEKKGIPSLADSYGYVHASINNVGAITGRTSVTRPALQTLPKKYMAEWPIREGFIAPDGQVFIAADYNQMEMRLMAIFSRDPVLLRLYREGKDVHQHTANQFGCDRQAGKTCNFALIYKVAWRRLMEQLLYEAKIPVTEEEARTYHQKFFATYTHILPFHDSLLEWHRKNGFIVALNGKVRSVPNLNSQDERERASAERALGNNIIQFSGAGWAKESMIRIDRDRNVTAAFLLIVHDELIYQVSENHAQEEGYLIKKHMETLPEICTFPVDIPMPVEVKVGQNWGKANELKFAA